MYNIVDIINIDLFLILRKLTDEELIDFTTYIWF